MARQEIFNKDEMTVLTAALENSNIKGKDAPFVGQLLMKLYKVKEGLYIEIPDPPKPTSTKTSAKSKDEK